MSSENISDAEVRGATGRDWKTWFEILDEYGASDSGHAATAAHLFEAYELSAAWSEKVADRYERERGLPRKNSGS